MCAESGRSYGLVRLLMVFFETIGTSCFVGAAAAGDINDPKRKDRLQTTKNEPRIATVSLVTPGNGRTLRLIQVIPSAVDKVYNLDCFCVC